MVGGLVWSTQVRLLPPGSPVAVASAPPPARNRFRSSLTPPLPTLFPRTLPRPGCRRACVYMYCTFPIHTRSSHVPRKALSKGQLKVSVREPRGHLTADLSSGAVLVGREGRVTSWYHVTQDSPTFSSFRMTVVRRKQTRLPLECHRVDRRGLWQFVELREQWGGADPKSYKDVSRWFKGDMPDKGRASGRDVASVARAATLSLLGGDPRCRGREAKGALHALAVACSLPKDGERIAVRCPCNRT